MAFILADRVRETASAPGTSTVTLLGAVTGYQTFSAGIGANNTTYYVIADQSGNNWEVGLGTIGAGGTTLARTTVLASSNSGSLVNFSSGTQDVFCDYAAGKAVYLNSSGNVSALGTITSGVWNGTTVPVAYGGTGVTASSGANSVVLRDSNANIIVNSSFNGFTSVAASGTQIVLTAASTPVYLISGSGGQTIKLPDATTLPNGVIFSFNNNQSSGAITVNNNSNTLVVSVPSGGYTTIVLLSNATAAGSWDRHDQTPSNVSWSTNTLDYAGSITNATWNGNTVAYNRGGTGQSSAFTAGGIVYGSTTSALAVTPIGTTGQVLTSAGAGTPTWTTPTTGTVTSVTGTSPVVSSGGNTPAISMPAATTSVSGYLTSTDWNTFNGKQPAGTYVNSVSGTTGRITSTGGTTPVIDLASGVATAGTTGSSTLIPVVTIDTYGRVTSITTASNPQGTVTSVTGTAPVVSSGGATPAISMAAANTTTNGYLTSTDWNTFNGKGSGTVTSVSLTAPSIFTVTGSPVTSSGTLALTYSGTALPILNGGTGQTTASAAFNALSPITTTGDLILGNGTNSATRLGIGANTYVLTSNGTTASWAAPSGGSSAFYTRTSFTATAGQTTFTVSYTAGYIQVYVNGVMLNGADYTATNGTSIVLAVGRATNDIVETIAFATGTVTPTNLSVGTSLVQGGTSGYVLYNNAGVVGNLATTGSGSVVLGTSPTIATPTITSLYGQNSNLVKTPYNGTGLIPGELIYRLDTAVVGANVGTPQSLLGVGVTVVASTVYQFEAVIALSKSAGTTNSYIQFLFGGTATVNNIAYAVNWEFDATSFGTSANVGQVVYIQVATAAQVSFANTTAAVYYKSIVKGTVSINAGGTFIPQYQQSTASGGAYTTAIGSYFKLSPLGASGSNTSIGTWA